MTIPDLPRIALSLAIAGKRNLGARNERVEDRLGEIFGALARSLDLLRSSQAADYLALRFDLGKEARLTLVSGLADGADQLAARAFLDCAARDPKVEHVLGAILPCERDRYVANSAVADKQTFDAQYSAARFVLELDGEMPPRSGEDGDPAGVRDAREYSFRAQAAFLLRHADILIAVDSPEERGRVGGTQDTIRRARERAIPVILVHTDGSTSILQTPRDFDLPPVPADDLQLGIDAVVGSLIGIGRPADPHYVSRILEEYFAPKGPGRSRAAAVWARFERWFAPGPSATAAPGEPPQGAHRERASALARFYAGRYRGTILIGYALAVAAVALAVASLVTMLLWPGSHVPEPAWIMLAALASVKLAVLTAIFRIIEKGNHLRLAHRAADYRYLSERLRSMVYLPLVGSLRAPPNPSRPYCTRVATQGVIDRLFDAIVRQIDPLALAEVGGGKVVRPDAGTALRTARRYWLVDQLAYHQRNRQTLAAMSANFEALGRRLNKAVIGIVALDIAIILLADFLPHDIGKAAHGPVALVLVSLAAIVPAAVASLNGIRFQTECSRLSDRSSQMSIELERLQASLDENRQSARLVDVLHAVEDLSRLTLDEVAEWSGIYGKELVDP